MSNELEPDVQIEEHGSIVLIRPSNDNVKLFLQQVTDGPWFGGALACEPRFVGEVVNGLLEAGFSVARGAGLYY